MEFNQIHFAQPFWLYAALAIPLAWLTYFCFYRPHHAFHYLEKFIDAHLLPHLLINRSNKQNSHWKYLVLWTIAWSFLTLALAGPRWSFREMEAFSRDQSLAILLDLSESMNAADIKPSRLVRAKQKIEDIINLSKSLKIGLIAFAADPHMITPLTDDIETIRHLLPTLDTDLIYIQGSKLSPALEMASTMLENEPGNNKSILIISDGGFEDASAMLMAKKLAEKGIVIHTMGVGTVEGAPIKNHEGNALKKNGTPILSKLERERFSEISKIGNGRYLEAHYSNHDESLILTDLEKRAETQAALGKKNRVWDERFYIPLLFALPVILLWFRRGYMFASILLLCLPTLSLQANIVDYFKSSEQHGKEALDQGNYESAAAVFQDPYRKGVSLYKAGNFTEAEKMFRNSFREGIATNAAYNLGNSLVQQQKLKEAITAYENVLEKWPDHVKAKENLELVKKMLEQQKQQDSSSSENSGQEPNKEEQNKENQANNNSKDKQQGNDSDSKKPEDKKSPTDNSDKGDSESSDVQKNDQKIEQQKPEENDNPNSSSEQQKPQLEGNETREGQNANHNDQDANLWLNRMNNDPKKFMKNKFYIESKKNGATEGIDPW